MTADYRALCAELLDALENAIGVIYGEGGTKHISTADAVITKADAALAQPEPHGHQAIAKRAIESCLAQRDEVLAAFIAKYGFQPEDAILVEQRQPDGTSTWRTERRPGPEPVGEALTVQECNDMHKHRENYIYECSYGDIELDGVFSREDLLELARTIPANQQPPES